MSNRTLLQRLAVGSLALLAACGGTQPEQSVHPPPAHREADPKQALLALVRQNYLYPETLPERVDPGDYQTLGEMLQALVKRAREQGLDRWSEVSPADGRPESVAGAKVESGLMFRYGLAVTGHLGQLRVSEVLPGSPAEQAGLRRGDRVLAAGNHPNSLATVAGAQAPLALTLAALHKLSARQSEFLVWIAGSDGAAPRLVALRRTPFTAAWVDGTTEARGWPGPGDQKIGYLRLRAFRPAAAGQLRQAVARLRAAGVTDLVLDLRGNGGGLVQTQHVLLNLLRRDAPAGEVMQRLQGRPGILEKTVHFLPEPEAIRPRRIAVLTDGGTASCSEFTLSALAAHHGPDLAQFGARTAGKPVGTRTYLGTPGFHLTLVAFRHLNRDGLANWFGGLPCPGFPSPSCAVEPDFDHGLHDPEEAGLAAALAWLRTGRLSGSPIS